MQQSLFELKGYGDGAVELEMFFDLLMVRMAIDESHKEIDIVTTSSNANLADAFWECFGAPCIPDGVDENKVQIICTDLNGGDYRKELKDYIARFIKGWLPSDSE